MSRILSLPIIWIVGLFLAAAAGILAFPMPAEVEPKTAFAALLVITAIAIWASHALPEALTSIAFMMSVVLLGLAPPSVTFSGFAVGAIWLLLSGIVIGVAFRETGLGDWIAGFVLARFEMTFTKVIIGLVTVAFLLGFILPATIGRIAVLLPIALAFAESMGYPKGSRGYTGFAMAVACGTFLPTYALMPANLPALVHVGTAETLYGLKITYAEFMLWHFPVTGILRALMVVPVIIYFFRDQPQTVKSAPEHLSGGLNKSQRRLLIVLLITLGLWMTDFIHHISPAWVALLAAVVILMPAMKLVPEDVFHGKINISPFFYLAGVLGAAAVIVHNGVGDLLANYLLGVMDFVPGDTMENYASIIGISTLLSLLMTMPGAPAVLVPIAQELSTATGMSLLAVIMTQMAGLTIMLLPYQGPPIVVAMSMAGLRLREVFAALMFMAAVMIFILTPLNYLWWRMLGLI